MHRILILLALLGMMLGNASTAWSQNQPARTETGSTLTVNGQGEVMAVPD